MEYKDTLLLLNKFYALARFRINRVISDNNLNFDDTWTLIHEELDCRKCSTKFDTTKYENEAIKELVGVYGLSVFTINGYIEERKLDKVKVWEQLNREFDKISFKVQ